MSALCAQTGLTISECSLGKKINNNLKLLESEGISCKRISGHRNGRLYRLTLMDED